MFESPQPRKESEVTFSKEKVGELLVEARQERLRSLEEYVRENPNQEGDRMSSEHFKRERIHLPHLEIDFIGVAHIPETAVKYGQEIEASMAEADFVWLEGSRKFLEDKSDYLKESVTVEGENTSEQYFSNDDKGGAYAFYEYLTLLARAHQKEILIADPVDTDRADFGRAAELPLYGVSAALLVATGTDFYKQEVSRRTFLKSAAAGAVLMGAHRVGINNGLESDYRNIAIASAMMTVDKTLRGKKKMTVVYGAAHLPRIKYWLEHPEELEEVRKNTSIIDALAWPTKLKAYRYAPTPDIAKQLPNGKVDMSTVGNWKTTLDVTL
jgi:hypothetical protein